MNTGYFNIKKDVELINSGSYFFCEACLVARPLDDQSPDSRYCQNCFDILTLEADLLTEKSYTRRPDWWPAPKKQGEQVKGLDIPQPIIMSTVKAPKNEVDIISPPVGKRGPKFTELPDDLIRQWAGEGIGSKMIASRLADQGIFISYKTIQRRLQGTLI